MRRLGLGAGKSSVLGGGDAAQVVERDLHAAAHSYCFIANSVNFPVKNEPEIVEAAVAAQ